MNSSKLSSLLFTFGLILIISHAADAKANKTSSGVSKLVANVCKAALEDRAKCMQVLRSDPKILSSKSHAELSKSILELAVNKSSQGQKFLKELALTKKSLAIEQCATIHYDGVVASFKSALLELEEDPDTANGDAKVAGDGADSCGTGLAAEHIVNPAISSLNKDIKLLSKIAFLATK